MAILIGGHQRSGTTLLRNLCDRHPEMSVTGEFANFLWVGNHFWRYRRSLTRRWREKHPTLSKGDGPPPPSEWRTADFLEGYLNHLRRPAFSRVDSRAIEGALENLLPDARLVGDKYPDYVFHLSRFAGDDTLKCVMIYRDGRDVASSVAERVRTTWKGKHFVGKFDTVEKVAGRWVKSIRLMETWREGIHVMRYEDLVSKPRKTLRRLARFLDVDPRGFHPRSIRCDRIGKHLEGLSRGELDRFLRTAGATLERLGYL
jgi:hypothetical protein